MHRVIYFFDFLQRKSSRWLDDLLFMESFTVLCTFTCLITAVLFFSLLRMFAASFDSEHWIAIAKFLSLVSTCFASCRKVQWYFLRIDRRFLLSLTHTRNITWRFWWFPFNQCQSTDINWTYLMFYWLFNEFFGLMSASLLHIVVAFSP